MNYLIVLLSKIAKRVLSINNGGTAFPGNLALKLNKNILSYFKLPKTIFVTGTTGKTSISGTLYEIYKNAGYKVCSNIKGSNLIGGVTTAIIDSSKLNGKSKVDTLIIEIDERYVKKVFKYITPDYFIINNLSRDQLARNGHFSIVFDEINNSIKESTHLILNADDPLVSKFSIGKKNQITYFGLEKTECSTKKSKLNTLDMSYCPKCHEKLEYDYFNYGSLGNYKCLNNDFKREAPKYLAYLDKDTLIINGDNIKLCNTAIYNTYNIACCYTMALVDNVNKESLVNTLSELSIKVKRLNEVLIDGIKTTILLSKNETPISYNQSIEYITSKKGTKTVAIGFTRISGRYDLKDLSWLYDINFELLNDKSIERIILIGPFAYDIATRLKLASINTNKFKYCIDYTDSLNYSLKNAIGDLYFAVYFDLDYKYIDELRKRGIKI